MSVGRPITLESSLHPFLSLWFPHVHAGLGWTLECPPSHCPRGYCAPCLTTVWSSHSLERALIPSGSGAPLVLLWNHSAWTDSKSFLWKDIYIFPHNRINSRNFFKARTNFFSSLFQMNKPRQRSCVSWLKPHMESHSLGIKITDNHFLFFLSI